MHVVTALVVALSAMVATQLPAPAATTGVVDQASYCSVDIRQPQIITCTSSPSTIAPIAASRANGVAPMASSLLIGRLYDNANYNTDSGYLNIYAGADCTPSGNNIDAQLSDLGAWKNRVSSFKSFGHCAARLWSATGFHGTAYPNTTGFTVNSRNVGAMNDRTQSVQFS